MNGLANWIKYDCKSCIHYPICSIMDEYDRVSAAVNRTEVYGYNTEQQLVEKTSVRDMEAFSVEVKCAYYSYF